MTMAFQCAECRGVFDKGQTDMEAVKERDATFYAWPKDQLVLVCDDCYHVLMERAGHQKVNGTWAPLRVN